MIAHIYAVKEDFEILKKYIKEIEIKTNCEIKLYDVTDGTEAL